MVAQQALQFVQACHQQLVGLAEKLGPDGQFLHQATCSVACRSFVRDCAFRSFVRIGALRRLLASLEP